MTSQSESTAGEVVVRGERWRKRERGKQETRTVVDQCIGGAVIYLAGNGLRTLTNQPQTVGLEEWRKWKNGAVRL